MSERFDVLVVGGGPVGACTAALLARGAALRVAVLEPHPPADADSAAEPDPRVVALSRASERILRSVGAWAGLPAASVCAYERMQVWHESVTPDSAEVLVFDAADVGEPNLGHLTQNRLVQLALLHALRGAGGTIIQSSLEALHVGTDDVAVRTREGDVFARLVVGADGAQSPVRHGIGLTSESVDYGQTAIVATVTPEVPHRNTAWQRFTREGTLALLPLADGTVSIVWSADDALAQRLLACTPEEFESELGRACAFVLGALRLTTQRLSFPLRRLAAHRYVAHRCVLVGDAAHVVHPLAGQGLNLGLLDAAVLAEVVLDGYRESEDPGAMRALRRYERWRKSDVAMMSAAIDAFDRLLAHGPSPLALLARRGLGWVNRSTELKRLFIRHALGVAGNLPRTAAATTR